MKELLSSHPEVDCGAWVCDLYRALRIYVVTPFGLAGPYSMKHGGAQGDSMGVGAFTLMGVLRTRANRSIVLRALRTDTGQSGGPDPHTYCFEHPGLPGVLVPEVTFSDNRRLFAKSAQGAARRVSVGRTTCTVAVGSLNADKLRAFGVHRLEDQAMGYVSGAVASEVGELPPQKSGLSVVGVPMVMGESTAVVTQAFEKAVDTVRKALWRVKPVYPLALQVLLAYAVASAEYVFDVVQVPKEELRGPQVALDKGAKEALAVSPIHADRGTLTPGD